MINYLPVFLFLNLYLNFLDAFLPSSVSKLRSTSVIQRFKDDDGIQVSSSFDIAEDEYPRLDSTWWQIFADEKNLAPPVVEQPKFIPDVGAWRAVFVEEKQAVVVEDESPPTLKEYFDGAKVLGANHENNIQGLWSQMKNRRSLKCLSAADVARVTEALRVAYVSLWGKHTKRSLEVSINRARGTAAVLGELEADLDVVIAAILSDVLSELSDIHQSEGLRIELKLRFGNDVISLSEKYNKLPTFMSKKADYTQLQSENQIQVSCENLVDYDSMIRAERYPHHSTFLFLLRCWSLFLRSIERFTFDVS